MSAQTTPLETHEAASTFAALGSEQRLDILQSLVRAGPAGLSMGDLGERTGVTGSTLTHHLKILNAANLVEQRKNGRSIVCTAVAFGQVELLSRYLLLHCCADAERELRHKRHDHA